MPCHIPDVYIKFRIYIAKHVAKIHNAFRWSETHWVSLFHECRETDYMYSKAARYVSVPIAMKFKLNASGNAKFEYTTFRVHIIYLEKL